MNIDVKKSLALVAGTAGIAVLSVCLILGAEAINARTVSGQVSQLPGNSAATPVAANETLVGSNPNVMLGQVISVKPHYVTTMVPYRVCHQVQQVYYSQPYNYYPGSGAVLGGITGGFIGNAMGHGHGRAAATVAGAMIGAIGGSAIEQNMYQPRAYASYGTVCSKHYAKRTVQKGYEVTYVYNGQQGEAIMQTPPTSNVIPLTLAVSS